MVAWYMYSVGVYTSRVEGVVTPRGPPKWRLSNFNNFTLYSITLYIIDNARNRTFSSLRSRIGSGCRSRFIYPQEVDDGNRRPPTSSC
jgi:hypothetical protein